jgi:ketosteroid isomerase-like protein
LASIFLIFYRETKMELSFKRLLLPATLAVAFVTQGCGTETLKDTRAADEVAIRQQSMAWSNAAQSRNMDKALTFYAPDAIALPDGGPIATSQDAISAEWQPLLSNTDATLSWKTTAVTVAKSSDIAYEYGAYTLDTTGKDGKISTRTGKYVLVWKKQPDGSWKVAIDTDNSDAPPAPAPPAHPAHHAAAKKHRRHH